MKNLILLLALIYAGATLAELPRHQFDYKNKAQYAEFFYGDGLTIENCNGCDPLIISDYLENSIRELLSFKKLDRGQMQEWKVGKKAIVVDYHHNYLHLMKLESMQDERVEIKILKTYEVSGGHGGVGNNPNTQATPPGIHTIWKKQDGTESSSGKLWPEDYVIDAYKVNHRAKVMTPSDELIRFPSYRDKESGKYHSWQFVTTRILRLRGLEERNNNSERGKSKRSILIHGTNEEGLIGIQASSGCIRMRGHEVIDLFQRVEVNTLVTVAYVYSPWESKAGKKRVGRPNVPFWNYGKKIELIDVNEANRYWVQ